MANIRFTCEAHFKKCDQPKKEAVLKDEKGNPQFQMIICTTCMGVVDSYKIIPPKEDKPKKGPAKKPEKPTEEPIETKVVELPKVEDKPKETQEDSSLNADQVSTPDNSPEAIEAFVKDLESKDTQLVETLLKMKERFGMTNSAAAKFLKDRKAKMEAEQQKETVETKPEPEIKQEEVKSEVKEEPKAKTIPAPLTEKDAKDAEASPIKPGNHRKIKVTEKLFPVTGFQLDHENKGYLFKLATEDGLEFSYSTIPDVAKYERVCESPDVFKGRSLLLKFDTVDECDAPIDALLIGLK